MDTGIAIFLIIVGIISLVFGLLRPPQGALAGWRRWRLLIGGPAAVVLGILVLAGVIGT